LRGIGHEVEDELGQHGIEGLVVEWKRLGTADPDISVGHPGCGSLDERLGRIDGSNVRCADALCEGSGEHARSAADVEDARRRFDARDVDQRR
jgi:hypothetical protein